MPVIATTDPNTDLGKIMEDNGFGLYAESGDLVAMNKQINQLAIDHNLMSEMGQRGFDYMKANYTVMNSFTKILNHFKESNYKIQ